MANVNAILEEVKANDMLSRSWRVNATGAAYAPVEGEIWNISPNEPYGTPMGGQTAVKAVVSDQERTFWPSWLVRTFPIPQKNGKLVLRGHTLNGKEVSSLPLEDILSILSSNSIKVSSVETVVGLKKVYTDNVCTGLREEVISLYHWNVVEETPKK